MSTEPTWYFDQFSDDIEHLLQDPGGRFEGLVRTKQMGGESADYINQYGATSAQANEDRRGDTPHIDVPRHQRWVFPETSEWGHLMSRRDFFRMMPTDEKGQLLKAAMMAMKRHVDRVILIPAFFRVAKTGNKGTLDTSFPSSQQVDVAEGAGAATGMNLEKIRAALEILQINDAPGPDEEGYEEPVLKIAPKQNRELLADYQAASREFQNGVIIKGGRVTQVYEARVQIQNGLETNASGHRRCPLWLPSGMGLGIWEANFVRVAERADKKFDIQLFCEQMFGATRLDEEKVVEIPCAE